MFTALKWAYQQSLLHPKMLHQLGLRPQEYYLATVHRAENTDDLARLSQILSAFNQLDGPLVFPVHPRTRKKMAELGWVPDRHIELIEPVGYLDMACLEGSARMILTDSGGIQKEAAWLGVPCVTLRNETEWVETLAGGWNQLVGADCSKILAAVRNQSDYSKNKMVSDEEDPAGQIIEGLISYSSNPGGITHVDQDPSKR